MIARRVKLRLTRPQTAALDGWLWSCTGVWNWALAKLLEREQAWQRFRDETPPPAWAKGARNPKWLASVPGGTTPTAYELYALLNGHSKRMGLPIDLLRGVVDDVVRAHQEYRRGEKGRPKWKGKRNRLNSLRIKSCVRLVDDHHLTLPTIGAVKICSQKDLVDLCANGVKQARLQRLPRGWYLTLQVDAAPKAIPLVSDETVGIDFGFTTLATLSTGEKIANPAEYRRLEQRIGQAARGRHRRLLAALQQRLSNARRVRNHQISRDLVSRHQVLYVSRDNLKGLQRTFGKSVHAAAIGQLLGTLAAKCRQAGRVYVEVNPKQSTRTCSTCGALSGPTGQPGLSVRQWECGACGAPHDRDINAAINTLRAGAASALRVTARAAA
ncbi:MAG: transposase [Gemmatimonadaceae bacterium]|nr:transposase [Gemmatimonadaceae bacterium]